MSFEVKICGITSPEAIAAAANAGADAVGFVFAESPRQIGLERARELARLCPPSLARVAVFHHPSPDEVALVLESVDIDWVQSDVQDHAIIAAVLADIPFRPVYRDTPDLHETLAAGERRAVNTHSVLVEGPRSGSGQTPDWRRIAELPRSLRIILAGGLTPQNVGDAIRAVRPVGVDTSSGVESAPGVKDPAKITAFVNAARAAHAALNHGEHR